MDLSADGASVHQRLVDTARLVHHIPEILTEWLASRLPWGVGVLAVRFLALPGGPPRSLLVPRNDPVGRALPGMPGIGVGRQGPRGPGDRGGVSYLLKCWVVIGLGGCWGGFDEEKEEGYEWL